MLWRLKVTSRTRAVLVGVLALGLFACIAAGIKMQYLVNYGKMGDLLWDSRNITIWTVTESNVGIVAESIPMLRPLFKNFFGGIYGTGSKRTGATPASYGHGSVAFRSKNRWHGTAQTPLGVKGEDRVDDSSERAINCFSSDETEGYELDVVRRRQGVTTVISARGPDDEALAAIDKKHPGHSFRGIAKVTQTTVDVSEAARQA